MDEEQRKRVSAAVKALYAGTSAEQVMQDLKQEDWLHVLRFMEEFAASWAEGMEQHGMEVPDRVPFRMPKPN